MRKDLVLVTLFISILALMVIPLPSGLIDVLLAANLSLSVVLLMVAVYLKRPSDFSTFPSVILIATAFRLSLSIATTRLILSEADAGEIIATFGDFVVRGSVVIGLVIFLIITVVQFVVVTKGAERVAEVAARFTLDAMPGKQMSIEADIRAGTLKQEDGALQRKELDKDSQFFGAMDGAMKFVKGDAIAGLIIIFINLLGGIAVGTTVHGLSLGEATSVYSLLTIGDGLVAQIPALLMSLCAGTVVTRVAKEGAEDLGSDIAKEIMSDARVPAAASFVILGFGFVPGFPFVVFATVAVILFVGSIVVRKALYLSDEDKATRDAKDANISTAAENNLPLSDRFGLRLAPASAEMLDVIAIRDRIEEHVYRYSDRYGVTFCRPFIDVGESTSEDTDQDTWFQIELDEVAIDSGKLPTGHAVSVVTPDQLRALDIDALTPIVDWITKSQPRRFVPIEIADRLQANDIETVSLETALAECVFRRLESNVRVLFAVKEYEELIECGKAADDSSVSFVTEKQGPQTLIRVFRYLLEDGVPLRPKKLLFESLSQWIHLYPDADPIFLAECLRTSMKRQLCQNLANSAGELGVSMISPALEERILYALRQVKSIEEGAEISSLPLEPELTKLITTEVRGISDLDLAPDRRIAIVCAPEIRRRLRNFLANSGLNVPVISPHEVSQDIVTIPVMVLGENLKSKAPNGSDIVRRRNTSRMNPKSGATVATHAPAT